MRRHLLLILILAVAFIATLRSSVVGAESTSGRGPQQVVTPFGSCVILGRVIDTEGNPVDGVLVSLNGGLIQTNGMALTSTQGPGGVGRVLTNQSGQFTFLGLQPGSYSLDASKIGYSAGAFGRLRASGTAQSLVIDESNHGANVEIRIFRFGAVAGMIRDEIGEPVVGVSVNVLRRTYASGRAQFASVTSVQTDDRGLYRAGTLPAGDYVVSVPSTHATVPLDFVLALAESLEAGGSRAAFMDKVGLDLPVSSGGARINDLVFVTRAGPTRSATAPPAIDGGRVAVYPTTFQPATATLRDARVIQLNSGQQVEGADLSLRLVPTYSITGHVVGPAGAVANLGLRLVSDYAAELVDEAAMDVAVTVTNGRGEFTFLGVPVGEYAIRAVTMPATPASTTGSNSVAAHTYWANQTVMVSGPPTAPVVVTLGTGFRISGQIEFDGTSTRPSAKVVQAMVVQIQSLDGHETDRRPLSIRASENGDFTTHEIPPGRYVVRITSSDWAGVGVWAHKASLLNGIDISVAPMDLGTHMTGVRIVMSDRANDVTGAVRDAQRKPDAMAAVLIFPTDRNKWTNFGMSSRTMRNVRPSTDGLFRIPNLPVGDYYVIAVPDERTGDWMNPVFLTRLTGDATKVRIIDGQKTHLNLTTSITR